jgi:hypothetical protein
MSEKVFWFIMGAVLTIAAVAVSYAAYGLGVKAACGRLHGTWGQDNNCYVERQP